MSIRDDLRGIIQDGNESFVAEIVSIDRAAKQVYVRVGGSILPVVVSGETQNILDDDRASAGGMLLVQWRDGRLYAGRLYARDTIIRAPSGVPVNVSVASAPSDIIPAPRLNGVWLQGGWIYVDWEPVDGAEYYEVWCKQSAESLPTQLIVRTTATEHRERISGSTSELIINGGFESGDLTGWLGYSDEDYPSTPDCGNTISSDDKYDGAYSLKQYWPGAVLGSAVIYSQFFAVSPSQSYTVRAYVRNGYMARVQLYIRWYNQSRQPLYQTAIAETTSSSWTQIGNTITSPSTAGYGKLVIYTGRQQMVNDRIYAYIDNVSCIGQPYNPIGGLFAVRAYRGGQYSPFSAWLQPVSQGIVIGLAELVPAVGILATVPSERGSNRVFATDGSIVTLTIDACEARRTGSAQSIPNDTSTAIQFNGVNYDTNTMWTSSNPTRITIKRDGLYLLTYVGYFEQSSTGVRVILINVNGSTLLSTSAPIRSDGFAQFWGGFLVRLNTNDYIELMAYQNSGGALNVGVGYAIHPRLAVAYIGRLT